LRMRKKFLAIYPQIGTKHKPSPQHLQQRSPYYWWWAYLRRNADYTACCEGGGVGELAALYADFGDVRSDDFRNWWGAPNNKGDYLFAEGPLELSVQKIDAAAEMNKRWGCNVLYVAVNMDMGRRQLQKKFTDLLQTEHKGKRGRKSLQTAASTARYPLHRNFTQHSLKVMLAVYDAVVANGALAKEQRKPLWAVGESLKLVPNAMPHKWDNPYDTRKKHATMTMTVSRYVKQARAIIANTAKGQFPNSEL
jgi:hypothetical protein